MIAGRDQFAVIDFMLVDFSVSQKFKTLDEVLVRVVRDAHREVGGYQVPVRLARVCQDKRLLEYFKSVLGGAIWDYNDFAMYFHGHDERWEYNPSTQNLRMRSPQDRLARFFKNAKKPDEVARLLLKANNNMLQQLGPDTLQLVLRTLAEPPTGAELARLGAASGADHQAFKNAQVKILVVLKDLCQADRASLSGLCGAWRLLPGFGGASPEPNVQSLRAEILETLPRAVVRLLHNQDISVDLDALSGLVDMPLDWNSCAPLVAKRAQLMIRREPPEKLAPLLRKLSSFGTGDFEKLVEAVDAMLSSAAAILPEQSSTCSATINSPLVSHSVLGVAAERIPDGTLVELRNLVAKPENNGRQGHIKSFIDDVQKYEVMLMSGKSAKVKRENLAIVQSKAKPKTIVADRKRSRSRSQGRVA